MTILLPNDLRVGGVLLASGTTQTFGADLEADIVARKGANYLTDPTPGKTVPVVGTEDPVRGGFETSIGKFSGKRTVEVFPIDFKEVAYTVSAGAPKSDTGGDFPASLYSFSHANNQHIDWLYVGKSSSIKITGAVIASPLVFRDVMWRLIAAIIPQSGGIVAVPAGAAWVSRTYGYSGGFESAALKLYLPRQVVWQDKTAIDAYNAEMVARRDALLVSPNQFFSVGTQYGRILAALNFIRKVGAGTLHLATDTIGATTTWTVDRPLILPSNTAIYIDNATLKLANGVFDNTIRSESITFDPDNPNSIIKHLGITENVKVYGSGVGTAFIEGPTVPYNAPHPISGGGGVNWVSDKYGWRTIGILLANVKNYSVGGFTIRNCSAWAISNEHGCDNFTFDTIVANSTNLNGDGIDIRKGCSNGVIKNISGTQQDDTVALTCVLNFITAFPSLPYIWPMQVLGDVPHPEYGDDAIRNITVYNIDSASSANQVRVLATGGGKIDNIAINDVTSTGAIGSGQQIIIHTSPTYGGAAVLGDMTNITVNKVACNHASTPVVVDAPVQNCHVNYVEKLTALGATFYTVGGYGASAENLTVTNTRNV